MTTHEMPTKFCCELVPERDRVRVALAGELDMATAEELERAVRELLDSGFAHLILDLSDLAFLDSSGLRAILRLHAASAQGSFRLELKPGPPTVQRIFELTGMVDTLPFIQPLRRTRGPR
jgi:anti-anti-sigma factor